jgi:hypothetical protein
MLAISEDPPRLLAKLFKQRKRRFHFRTNPLLTGLVYRFAIVPSRLSSAAQCLVPCPVLDPVLEVPINHVRQLQAEQNLRVVHQPDSVRSHG